MAILLGGGGSLFGYEKRTLGKIVARKVETLLLPWMVTGSIVFLWTYLRHGEINVLSYISFLIGYGSYLWYMTVFVILLTAFSLLRHKKYIILLPAVYGAIITIPGILPAIAGNDYKLYYFLVGGWPIAFSLGLICNRWNLQKKIYSFLNKRGWICGLVFSAFFILFYLLKGRLYYWSIQYIPLCFLFSPTALWITILLEKNVGNAMDYLGRMSFTIYLLHMPIVGIVNNILCRFDRGYTVIIRPFIVLFICYFAIKMLDRLFLKRKSRLWIRKIIGLR